MGSISPMRMNGTWSGQSSPSFQTGSAFNPVNVSFFVDGELSPMQMAGARRAYSDAARQSLQPGSSPFTSEALSASGQMQNIVALMDQLILSFGSIAGLDRNPSTMSKTDLAILASRSGQPQVLEWTDLPQTQEPVAFGSGGLSMPSPINLPSSAFSADQSMPFNTFPPSGFSLGAPSIPGLPMGYGKPTRGWQPPQTFETFTPLPLGYSGPCTRTYCGPGTNMNVTT